MVKLAPIHALCTRLDERILAEKKKNQVLRCKMASLQTLCGSFGNAEEETPQQE